MVGTDGREVPRGVQGEGSHDPKVGLCTTVRIRLGSDTQNKIRQSVLPGLRPGQGDTLQASNMRSTQADSA